MNPEIIELTQKAMRDNAAILHALEQYDRKEKIQAAKQAARGT